MSIGERLYSHLTALLAVGAGVLFLCRARGRARLAERFGFWEPLAPGTYYWIHGASVGEVKGLLPVVERLRLEHPEGKILLTATSVTGLQVAEGYVDERRLLPFDSRIFIERALRSADIRGFIFGETEIWPTLVSVLVARRVPLVMVNGRIRASTVTWYRRFPWLFGKALSRLARICVGSSRDAERFLSAGVVSSQMTVTGNTKYDRRPTVHSASEADRLRATLFLGPGSVIALASLRPGEEEVWFPIVREALDQQLPVKWLVAPRHQEKFSFFSRRLAESGIPHSLRSSGEAHSSVVLLDSIGELESLYSLCASVFVGGTLRPFGGHNPLEPAAYGCEVVIGPSVDAIEEIVEGLRAADGVTLVRDVTDVRSWLRRFVEEPDASRMRGQRSKVVAESHMGAIDRTMEVLRKELRHVAST